MAQLASQSDPAQLNTVLVALQGTTETTDFFKQHAACSHASNSCVLKHFKRLVAT